MIEPRLKYPRWMFQLGSKSRRVTTPFVTVVLILNKNLIESKYSLYFQTTSKLDAKSYARSDTFLTGSARVSSPSRRWSARATVSQSGTYLGTPSSSRSGLGPRFLSGDALRTISVVSGLTYSVKTARHARIGSKWLRVVNAKDT